VGLDLVMLFDKSINVKKFKIYLDELRSRYFFDDICIYMDNLSSHVSNATKERLDELGIAYVYGPPYSPNFNGIEFCFSMIKQRIKLRRLRAIMRREEIDLKKVVM